MTTWTDGGHMRRRMRLYHRYFEGNLDYERFLRLAAALERRCQPKRVAP